MQLFSNLSAIFRVAEEFDELIPKSVALLLNQDIGISSWLMGAENK